MKELIRTNDAVVLSFAESLMKDAEIPCFIADQGMSILEGSLGLLPRRRAASSLPKMMPSRHVASWLMPGLNRNCGSSAGL
jgi:hypothetical protein